MNFEPMNPLREDGFRAGDKKRMQILDSVLESMADEGVENITFDSVGRRLGIGKANVRYHFKTKEDLFINCIKRVVLSGQKTTLSELAKAKSPSQELSYYIQGAFKWFKLYPSHAIAWSLFCHYCTFKENYRSLYVESRKAGQKRIREILQRQGGARLLEESNFDFLAEAIQNAITAHLLDAAISGRQKDLTTRQKRCRKQVALFLKEYSIDWSYL